MLVGCPISERKIHNTPKHLDDNTYLARWIVLYLGAANGHISLLIPKAATNSDSGVNVILQAACEK